MPACGRQVFPEDLEEAGHRWRIMNTEQGISNEEVGAGSEPAPTKFLVQYSILKEM